MNASTPRVRFNWEDAVAHDRDLQRIDAFVKLTISKFPGQPAPRANAGRGSRYQPAPPAVKAELPASVKQERMRAAAASEADSENEAANATEVATMDPIQPAPTSDNTPTTGATTESDSTSIPIAQALADDPEKSNLLLIHACNCDDVKCTDPEFHVFCPHMKRFLRSVCWASHSDKWRAYRLARITAELFAYHAMNCTVPQCNVPLCVKIREEEIV
ncbi:hypothetical protein JG688_00008188 [Phytophthora aleatoria]|uniref:Uncharacterized protein n=1 Tax=Phytophthora aleatoria TaxID=2496075 RepID=A0A8J5IYS8_9STRA|nr:hypothetical protein JG688_00008188 [Phytophthora aleatoria]